MVKIVLRCWPEFFEPMLDGRQQFDYRRDDRGFKVGDTLLLREYRPDRLTYTGRELVAGIIYILHGDARIMLPEGFCILGLRFEEQTEAETLTHASGAEKFVVPVLV